MHPLHLIKTKQALQKRMICLEDAIQKAVFRPIGYYSQVAGQELLIYNVDAELDF